MNPSFHAPTPTATAALPAVDPASFLVEHGGPVAVVLFIILLLVGHRIRPEFAALLRAIADYLDPRGRPPTASA